MDSEHTANRVPSVSPIPTTLKRKRGPSISGDLPVGGKPALKQSKEEATEAALEDLDELEEYDSSDAGSDSSGMVASLRKVNRNPLTHIASFHDTP